MSRVGRRRVLLAGAGVAATALAGCSEGEGDAGPADRGPIEIQRFAFAADRPTGYDEYESQPNATYERGDLVWLYADYGGLSGEPVEVEPREAGDESGDADDGGDDGEGEDSQDDAGPTTVEIDLHQSLTVADPDGEPIVEDEATFREELAAPQLERYFTGTEILLPGDVRAGEYQTTVSITDRISETETSATATFRIEN